MHHRRARVLACLAVVTALIVESRAGDSSMPTFVPWKVLNPGDAPLKTDLVLYWIPSTRDEIRRSPLLTSRPLAIYSTQCVGMQLIRPDDDETIARLDAEGTLPIAILTSSDGAIVGRVNGGGGSIRLADVERMVRDTIVTRETDADHLLDDAKAKIDRGDRDGAVTLYRRVCAQRCLLPRKARDAQKALHRMGLE
jgi:hypothetical protein